MKSEDDIPISDVSWEVFQALIEYIYNKQPDLKDYDPVFIASLYYLAEKYIIEDLRDEIIVCIEEWKITKKTVLDVAVLAEESSLHEPLSQALYRVIVNFLRAEFGNRMERIVQFLTEFEVDEKHALVVFKILKLLVGKMEKTSKCVNCQNEPCLNGQGITQENYTRGVVFVCLYPK